MNNFEERIKENKLKKKNLKCCGNCEYYPSRGRDCRYWNKKVKPYDLCNEWEWDHLFEDVRKSEIIQPE